MNRSRENFLKLATKPKPSPINSASVIEDLYNDNDLDAKNSRKFILSKKIRSRKRIRAVLDRKQKSIRILFDEEKKSEIFSVNESGSLHYSLSTITTRTVLGANYDVDANVAPSEGIRNFEVGPELEVNPVNFGYRHHRNPYSHTYTLAEERIPVHRNIRAPLEMTPVIRLNEYGYTTNKRLFETETKPEFRPIEYDGKYGNPVTVAGRRLLMLAKSAEGLEIRPINDVNVNENFEISPKMPIYGPIALSEQQQRVMVKPVQKTTVYTTTMSALKYGLMTKVKAKYDREFDSMFVEEINGKRDGDGGHWEYFVNGEIGKVGIDKQVVNKDDVIEWRFIKPEEGCGGGGNGTPSYLPSKVNNEKYSFNPLDPNSLYTLNNRYGNLRFN